MFKVVFEYTLDGKNTKFNRLVEAPTEKKALERALTSVMIKFVGITYDDKTLELMKNIMLEIDDTIMVDDTKWGLI